MDIKPNKIKIPLFENYSQCYDFWIEAIRILKISGKDIMVYDQNVKMKGKVSKRFAGRLIGEYRHYLLSGRANLDIHKDRIIRLWKREIRERRAKNRRSRK